MAFRAGFQSQCGGSVKRFSMVFFSGLLIAMLPPRATAQFPPAPGTGPGLAETIEAIDSARVTTRILYVTAHPDDESAAALTYLARGLHADVALLSITRGEGGQNALGPEQAPQLGLIRTQELLAATRGYGVKLFFTRAKDFGFSKTPEETEKVWGDEVLRDIVEVIRSFRPNVVINGWGGVHTGHGHHQAAGLLTPKAVQLAADKSYKAYPGCADCPEESAWGSISNAVGILDLERGSDNPSGYVLPLDDVSPLWGKTWREIGLDAFVNHRTQGMSGFINSPFLRRPIALKREDGGKLDPEILAEPLHFLATIASADGCETAEALSAKLTEINNELGVARSHALGLRWKDAAVSIADVALTAQALRSLTPGQKGAKCRTFDAEAEFSDIQHKVNRAVQLVAGIEVNGFADRSEIAYDNSFKFNVTARCRAEVECAIQEPSLDLPSGMKELKRDSNSPNETVISVEVANSVKEKGWHLGEAEGLPLVQVNQRVTVAGYQIEIEQPVIHVAVTSTRVDRVPLRMVPAYTLSVEPKQVIKVLPGKQKPFDVFVRVHSYTSAAGKLEVVTLDVPYDWKTSPPVAVDFKGMGDQYVRLTVTPPEKLAPGNYEIKAYAKRDLPPLKITPLDAFSTSLEPLPSMPALLWEEPAQCVVHAFEIDVPENLSIGYITAEGEPIPQALQRLGIRVETLDTQALAFGDLSKYDAIVVGVRAYELRPELPGANQRLLDYVSNGGTLVVQYNRDFVWDKLQPAPHPAKIGNPTPRITDENSPVKFLKPDDPLLNRPNKITLEDFKGWVQERGLYFWSQFDPKYTPLLAMNDPGENDLNGALVYTHYGKGIYIYTGIAFFRQLPEGVPGAYRLFVNLLSASRGH
jgi:LmbE family N-acetylglucosaminyl deacetylase